LGCGGIRGSIRIHGAMMASIAAAAEGQARLADTRQESRKRPQPEKQNQRDGKSTAHFGHPGYNDHAIYLLDCESPLWCQV
jgi:hypothetical protein